MAWKPRKVVKEVMSSSRTEESSSSTKRLFWGSWETSSGKTLSLYLWESGSRSDQENTLGTGLKLGMGMGAGREASEEGPVISHPLSTYVFI